MNNAISLLNDASTLTGLARVMFAMAKNAADEKRADGGWVHCSMPKDKRAVASLEKRGLVEVRRTSNRISGLLEWYYRLAPAAEFSLRDVVWDGGRLAFHCHATIGGVHYEFARLHGGKLEVYDYPKSWGGVSRFVGYATDEHAAKIESIARR